MHRQAVVQAQIDEVLASLHDEDLTLSVPANLHNRLTKKLEENRAISWDTALLQIVSADGKEDA